MKPVLIKCLSYNLDCVVEQLIDCKNKGMNAYAVFNGHCLYSSNIDLNSAYMQVYGMNRDEYMNNLLKTKKEYYYEWTKNNIKPELLDKWRSFINEYLTIEYDKYDKSIIKAKYLADTFNLLKTDPIKLQKIIQSECANIDVLYLVSYIIECFFKDSYELSIMLKENISKRTNTDYAHSKSPHPRKRLVLMNNISHNTRRTY